VSSYADVYDHPGVQRLSVGYSVTERGRSVYVLPTEQGTWSVFEGPRLALVSIGPGPDRFATPVDAVNAWSTWMEAR
jgi:hypothetical protein